MYFQLRQSKRLIQYLAVILFLVPIHLGSEVIDDLFNAGISAAQTIDNALLDMDSVSDSDENKIGTELKAKILSNAKISKSQKFDVNQVMHKLTPFCTRTALKYDVTIIQSNVFNAYAIAGGKMFINTELLNGINNEDELAFVIAHEIAHNELKHCIHRIQHSYQASKINPTLGNVVQIAYTTYTYPFSKEIERQADEYGFKLMQKAGYNKAGALSFFEILEKKEVKFKDSNMKAVNDFISTHPTAQERRKRLEKL